MCKNLGALVICRLDSEQLFMILDCKMLVQYYFVKLKIIAS